MKVAVIIPCYRCKNFTLDVISQIGPEVDKIFAVDDKCPENTGDYIRSECDDPRVSVLWNSENLGVGGAVKSGYLAALDEGSEIMVKVDGDGQIPPQKIPDLIHNIQQKEADYCKGNRFSEWGNLKGMPLIRIIGNAGLSVLTKFSTGLYHLVDPTNGFTAIHKKALSKIDLDSVSNGYFFESDMLYQLYMENAVVCDVPMKSFYGEEMSNLNEFSAFFSFLFKNLSNLKSRVLKTYFLYDFCPASLCLFFGIPLMGFGFIFGVNAWIQSVETQIPATSGTVMLSALPIIVGLQLLISFFHFDISRVPKKPLVSDE